MRPIFTEADHKYTCPQTRQVYVSTTTLLGQYKPVKDWNLIAEKYAQKNGQTKEYWLAQWKKTTVEACEKGSEYHAGKELEDLATEVHQINGRLLSLGANTDGVQDLYSLPDGVYVEMLLWNDYFKIAGKADKVIIQTINGIRYVEIIDYKTSKTITDYNYIRSDGVKIVSEKLLAPLNNITNCNYNVYQLQLNIYAWMLVQFGFVLKGGCIIHVKDVTDPSKDEFYPLLNMQREVDVLMVDRHKKLRLQAA